MVRVVGLKAGYKIGRSVLINVDDFRAWHISDDFCPLLIKLLNRGHEIGRVKCSRQVAFLRQKTSFLIL